MSKVKELKEKAEAREHRLLVEFMDETKCKELVDFLRIQQGLNANKKLMDWINELNKEE